VVHGAHADDALAVLGPQHAHGCDPVDDVGSVHGRGPRQLQHEAGVVDLGVVVLDRAGQGVRAQAGHEPQSRFLAQVPVPRETRGLAHAERESVIEGDARADVEALPRGLAQRIHERHGPHEVRGDRVEQEAALLECLVDEPEVEHLEVAQPAVDELARA